MPMVPVLGAMSMVPITLGKGLRRERVVLVHALAGGRMEQQTRVGLTVGWVVQRVVDRTLRPFMSMGPLVRASRGPALGPHAVDRRERLAMSMGPITRTSRASRAPRTDRAMGQVQRISGAGRTKQLTRARGCVRDGRVGPLERTRPTRRVIHAGLTKWLTRGLPMRGVGPGITKRERGVGCGRVAVPGGEQGRPAPRMVMVVQRVGRIERRDGTTRRTPTSACIRVCAVRLAVGRCAGARPRSEGHRGDVLLLGSGCRLVARPMRRVGLCALLRVRSLLVHASLVGPSSWLGVGTLLEVWVMGPQWLEVGTLFAGPVPGTLWLEVGTLFVELGLVFVRLEVETLLLVGLVLVVLLTLGVVTLLMVGLAPRRLRPSRAPRSCRPSPHWCLPSRAWMWVAW